MNCKPGSSLWPPVSSIHASQETTHIHLFGRYTKLNSIPKDPACPTLFIEYSVWSYFLLNWIRISCRFKDGSLCQSFQFKLPSPLGLYSSHVLRTQTLPKFVLLYITLLMWNCLPNLYYVVWFPLLSYKWKETRIAFLSHRHSSPSLVGPVCTNMKAPLSTVNHTGVHESRSTVFLLKVRMTDPSQLRPDLTYKVWRTESDPKEIYLIATSTTVFWNSWKSNRLDSFRPDLYKVGSNKGVLGKVCVDSHHHKSPGDCVLKVPRVKKYIQGR